MKNEESESQGLFIAFAVISIILYGIANLGAAVTGASHNTYGHLPGYTCEVDKNWKKLLAPGYLFGCWWMEDTE